MILFQIYVSNQYYYFLVAYLSQICWFKAHIFFKYICEGTKKTYNIDNLVSLDKRKSDEKWKRMEAC